MSEPIAVFGQFDNYAGELAHEIVNEFKKFDLSHIGDVDRVIQEYADRINLISDRHVSIQELSQLSVDYLFEKLNIIPGTINDSGNIIVMGCDELSFPYRIIYGDGSAQKDILVGMCEKAVDLIRCLSVIKSLRK